MEQFNKVKEFSYQWPCNYVTRPINNYSCSHLNLKLLKIDEHTRWWNRDNEASSTSICGVLLLNQNCNSLEKTNYVWQMVWSALPIKQRTEHPRSNFCKVSIMPRLGLLSTVRQDGDCPTCSSNFLVGFSHTIWFLS